MARRRRRTGSLRSIRFNYSNAVTNSDRIDMERMRIKDQATLKYGGGAGRAFLYGFTRGLVGESVADTIAQTFRNKQKTEQAYSRSFKRPDPIKLPEQPALTSSGDEETKILLERVVAKIDDVAIKVEKIYTRLKPTNITVGKGDAEQTFRYDPLAPAGKKVTVLTSTGKSGRFASKKESAAVLSKAAYLSNKLDAAETATKITPSVAESMITEQLSTANKVQSDQTETQIAAEEDRKEATQAEKEESDLEFNEKIIKMLEEILEKIDSCGCGEGMGLGLGLPGLPGGRRPGGKLFPRLLRNPVTAVAVVALLTYGLSPDDIENIFTEEQTPQSPSTQSNPFTPSSADSNNQLPSGLDQDTLLMTPAGAGGTGVNIGGRSLTKKERESLSVEDLPNASERIKDLTNPILTSPATIKNAEFNIGKDLDGDGIVGFPPELNARPPLPIVEPDEPENNTPTIIRNGEFLPPGTMPPGFVPPEQSPYGVPPQQSRLTDINAAWEASIEENVAQTQMPAPPIIINNTSPAPAAPQSMPQSSPGPVAVVVRNPEPSYVDEHARWYNNSITHMVS